MRRDKQPARLALANWPVRWKVFAVVAVPLALAVVLGGALVYSSVAAAVDLRGAAERTDMAPAVVDYLAALEDTMLAATEGVDAQPALTTFDSRRVDLQRKLAETEIPDSVRLATNTLLDDGQDLLGRVMGNAGDLRTRVMAYVPVLNTGATAIAGLMADGQGIRPARDALTGAVGVRGRMVMQQMLVTRGGELPEAVLRWAMLAVAGAESSMVSAVDTYLGAATDRATALRSQMDNRILVMSDPESVLVGNPELLASQRITHGIVDGVITEAGNAISATVDRQANDARSAAIRDAALMAAAIAIALLSVAVVGRSLTRPLLTLRDSTLKLVRNDLAREVDNVRSDGKPVPVQPIPVHTSEETGQVARAVDELHKQALQLAADQVRLRLRVTEMFNTASRRNRSLVDQQLALIAGLECDEEDPERLASVSVTALVDAATAGFQDSSRVVAGGLPDSEVSGAAAAADLARLLTELVDNALRHSPPTAQVTVSGVRTVNGGLVLEVADTGLGMTESDLRVANIRLKSSGADNAHTARQVGLAVVGRLAARHGLVVRLRSTVAGEPGSGITAGVYVPAALLVAADTAGHASRSGPRETGRADSE
ncbi:MAG: histidine kinase [Actinomycetia bacterium]|nr:histidine kinase [Actinomycetes bacterium]MCH9759599.1 histidine kinase [Actinomycetes bacterium]